MSVNISSAAAATWTVVSHTNLEIGAIQKIVDAASSGDTIVVGPGSYVGCIRIDTKNIVLRSLAGPEHTVLLASPYVRNPQPVVSFSFEAAVGSAIEGFTIRGGASGIQCSSASPVIRGNVITANKSALGAGICCIWGSSPQITDNLIVCNTAIFNCCMPSRGGGIYADATSAAQIHGNVIAGNHCMGQCMGGGVSAFVATIDGNTIYGNEADGPGGGVELPGDGAVLSDNVIAGNRSQDSGDGVAVFGDSHLTCNDVWSNGAEDYYGTQPGAGDYSLDPRFCGIPTLRADAGSLLRAATFNLRADSPCLPGQHPPGSECGLTGARSEGCGTQTRPQAAAAGSVPSGVSVAPNPTRSGALIEFATSPSTPAEGIDILDASGRLVARIAPRAPGQAYWDGRTGDGRPAPAGVYFIRRQPGTTVSAEPILLVR